MQLLNAFKVAYFGVKYMGAEIWILHVHISFMIEVQACQSKTFYSSKCKQPVQWLPTDHPTSWLPLHQIFAILS